MHRFLFVHAKDKGDMVELLFRIREYDKVRIRKVTFLRNKAFTDDQLKRTLRNTSEGGFFSWLTNKGMCVSATTRRS